MAEAQLHRRVFRQKLRTASWIPVLISLVLGAIIVFLGMRFDAYSGEVAERERVLTQANSVGKLLLDLETGQRGYLLTRDEPFLQPYHGSLGQIDGALQQLEQSLTQVLSPAPELFRLREELKIWKAYAARVIESRDVQAEMRGEGKRRMDSMRALLGEIINREEILRDEAQSRERDLKRLLMAAILGLALLAGWILSAFARSWLRALDRAYDERLSALEVAEEKGRLLLEGVRDSAIVLLDADGKIQTWNPGAEKLLGVSASDAIGKSYSIFFKSEDVNAGKPAQAIEAATRDGQVADEGWRLREDGTQYWAESVLSAIHDEGGKRLRGFALWTRDATTRRRGERERTRLIEKLNEAIESRDQFMGEMTRQIESPALQMRELIEATLRGKNGLVQIPPISKFIELQKFYRAQLDQIGSWVAEGRRVARIAPSGEPIDHGAGLTRTQGGDPSVSDAATPV